MPERVYLTAPLDLSPAELKKLKKSELVNRCIYADRVIDNGAWWLEDEIKKLKEENETLKEKCGEWKDKFMILEESAKKHLGNGFNDYKQ